MRHNIYLSIGSYITAAGGYFMWFVTNYYVLAVLGFIALVLGIYASIMTILEKRISIKQMKKHDKL